MKTPTQKTITKGMKPSTLFQLGLIFSLGITLVGFEYSHADIKREKVTTAKMEAVKDEIVYEFEVEKPKPEVENREQEQRPNTNTSTQTQQQVSTNIQTTQNQQQVTTNVGLPPSDTTVIIADLGGNQTVIVNEIFDIVEDMPTYESLLSITDKSKRKMETEKEMLGNIYKKVKYPELARQTGIQGKVYVEFIVDTDGKITDAKIKRSVHPDLDAEALRVVSSLPKMIPGKQRDKEVNVRYTIPIDFKLKN
jgi:protein TonB